MTFVPVCHDLEGWRRENTVIFESFLFFFPLFSRLYLLASLAL